MTFNKNMKIWCNSKNSLPPFFQNHLNFVDFFDNNSCCCYSDIVYYIYCYSFALDLTYDFEIVDYHLDLKISVEKVSAEKVVDFVVAVFAVVVVAFVETVAVEVVAVAVEVVVAVAVVEVVIGAVVESVVVVMQ